MNRLIRTCKEFYLDKRLDFRVRLFNVLATTGMLVSLLMAVLGFAVSDGIANFITNIIIATFSFLLLRYSYRSGQYQRCYIISIIAIFIILFSVLFFVCGGYHGGMPSFFIFAILFTVFMLEGAKAVFFTVFEILVYAGLCIYAYLFPEHILFYETEMNLMLNVLVTFVIVSILLATTMFIHFRMYNLQQRELTEARENALELSKAKSNFLANMSHEIRTPINVMLGMNEMILRESNSERVRSYGKNIQNAGQTLLMIINNILDVSKIEAGKLTISEECYSTGDLIDELAMIGEEQAGRYSLSFQLLYDDQLPSVLIGDMVQLKQVIVNFLSNAAKYTEEGSIKLSFSQKPGAQADEILLCISVADTGIGIRDESKKELFDAFVRADLAGHRYIEGTGLGLAIARELTELMDGEILVESVWGQGSVFSVEVPQKCNDKAPVGSREQPEETKEETGFTSFIAPGAVVLVVDDNKANLQVIRSLLSRTLLRVDLAMSGAECMNEVLNRHYDVILMDYMMPEMDGAETLKRLKNIPGFCTPVIAVTANVITGTRQKLLQTGFAEYLPKPIMWRDLEAALMALLPEELVTICSTGTGRQLSENERERFAAELNGYGISLTEGLSYISGDMRQYKALITYFLENYHTGRKELSDYADAGQYYRLKFCVHSLKSKARAVGALRLSDTAAIAEELCENKDEAYLAVLFPLLYHQWEQVKDGLSFFEQKLEEMFPGQTGNETAAAGIQELKMLISQNRQPEALSVIDGLLAAEELMVSTEQLRRIRLLVDDLEFEQALVLLSSITE